MSHQFKFLTLPHRFRRSRERLHPRLFAGHYMEDPCALRKYIRSSLHNGINIFAFWPSGHWAQFDNYSSKGILADTAVASGIKDAGARLSVVTAFVQQSGAHRAYQDCGDQSEKCSQTGPLRIDPGCCDSLLRPFDAEQRRVALINGSSPANGCWPGLPDQTTPYSPSITLCAPSASLKCVSSSAS